MNYLNKGREKWKRKKILKKEVHGAVLGSNNKRIIYFDILNILACISVIFLHHSGMVHTYSNTRGWKTSLIVKVIRILGCTSIFNAYGCNFIELQKQI